MAPLRFSLVLSTIGHRDDLMRFCASLDEQTYRHFELILVDQSESNQLVDVVRRFDSRFPIAHLRSARGLSRGRNARIEASTGQLICFPDDDSWYGRDLLERVAAKFEVRPVLDLVSGTVVDEAGAAVGRWDRRGGQITRWNVWHRAVSMSIFVRRHVIDEVGGFDEMIGVGSSSPFLSGEETDFVTRIIDKGFDCHYDPSLVAFHPSKKYSLAGIERAFGYGAGMGFVLAKQHFSVISAGVLFIRPVVGAAIYAAVGRSERARYQFETAKGRLWGYRQGRRLASGYSRRGPETAEPAENVRPRLGLDAR